MKRRSREPINNAQIRAGAKTKQPGPRSSCVWEGGDTTPLLERCIKNGDLEEEERRKRERNRAGRGHRAPSASTEVLRITRDRFRVFAFL
jgi:hypothetical protein